MFRKTFITAFARLGTFKEIALGDGDWEHVTASIDDNAATIEDSVVFRTQSGVVIDVDNTTIWKTLASARKRSGIVVSRDGRRSASAVGMFLLTDARLLTTNTKGKRDVGRTYTTPQLIEYALTWSDADYHGETKADRERDAGIVRAYLDAVTAA